jgi:hypothetical protein
MLSVICLSSSAIAQNDIRYCGDPQRAASGKIKRSAAVLRDFESMYPLPAGYKRSEWQIDHVIPLAVGGCDALHNLQWLPKVIKTCAEDHCKDRFERIIYK